MDKCCLCDSGDNLIKITAGWFINPDGSTIESPEYDMICKDCFMRMVYFTIIDKISDVSRNDKSTMISWLYNNIEGVLADMLLNEESIEVNKDIKGLDRVKNMIRTELIKHNVSILDLNNFILKTPDINKYVEQIFKYGANPKNN